jgi:Na+/H+-dicarboxylate symporter
MFPDNLVQATMQQAQTQVEIVNGTNGQQLEKYKLVHTDGMNILGIIIFCIAFGAILSQLGQRARTVVRGKKMA